MDCPKCGAKNPDYAVYCGTCSALIKKPRFRNGWKRRRRRIVIEDRWTRIKRALKDAVTLIVIATGIMLLAWLYSGVRSGRF